MVAFTGYEDKVKEEEWYRSEQTTQQTWVQVRVRSSFISRQRADVCVCCDASVRVRWCVLCVLCCGVVWCGVLVCSFARKTSRGRSR